MANRRSFSSGSFGALNSNANFNQNRNNYNLGQGLAGVSPWQSGNSPGRSGLQGGNNVPPLLGTNNLLNQLTTDSSIAIATKLLSSILPVQQNVQQPPSLMSLKNSYGNTLRYGGNGSFGNDRFRRDVKRTDASRNRRQGNDRNKDRKSGDNKVKTKTKSNLEREKGKKEDNEEKDDERGKEEDEEENQGEGQNEGNAKQEGPIPEYENIPTKLFNCHVCGKSMWNDVSFDTHVKGRNHRNKLRDLEESYQLQTDMMRQIAAMSLKLEELRRGAKRRPYADQYCKMCDLHFNGMTMFAHRSTTEHQNLKKFIHPSCDLCKVDFQVRIEYDEHILTPQHLQNEAKALLRREKYDKDPLYPFKDMKIKEKEMKLTKISTEVEDIRNKEDIVLSPEDRLLIKKLLNENEEPPEYDPDGEILVAEHFILPHAGYFCKGCKVILLTSDIVNVHCRTATHYNTYIEVLKAEATKLGKLEAEEMEENEKRKSESESNEDNSGNWKRRKLDNKNSEVNGGKKYDPEESLDDTLEDFPSDTSASASASGKGKLERVETSDSDVGKEEERLPRPTMTTRRGRGRARK